MVLSPYISVSSLYHGLMTLVFGERINYFLEISVS